MEPTVPEILEWVYRQLKKKKLSKAKASMKVAGNPEVIRNMERGRGRPKIETLRELARVLGDPPHGLLYGDAAPPPQQEPSGSLDVLSIEYIEATLEEARLRKQQADAEVEALEVTLATARRLLQKSG